MNIQKTDHCDECYGHEVEVSLTPDELNEIIDDLRAYGHEYGLTPSAEALMAQWRELWETGR